MFYRQKLLFLVKNWAALCHFKEKSYFCMLKGINDIPIPLNMCYEQIDINNTKQQIENETTK